MPSPAQSPAGQAHDKAIASTIRTAPLFEEVFTGDLNATEALATDPKVWARLAIGLTFDQNLDSFEGGRSS
ncbi:hypothetical protein [Botrimarina hoheduenensis]|uniref:Uncharacterized protein n=1 Tax=Botrimarina hoheduenensis TaxID=2528000 RepID=A0A5C5W735_9BACT|nr:hypothetical protein [Botrimarina hoheduenensis]TWT46706.1 hypothetical protein Pla111_18070 [Botrimarina hoheduenensis]